jgi:hypothetical protein
MTNSDSLGAESATEPTTKPESDAMNMSAGAEMLIARMKTNPDDFKYGGRFYRVVDAWNAGGQGWVSERDTVALKTAFAEHIQEAEFSEWVYNEIFNPKEEERYQSSYKQAAVQGQLAQMQNAMRNSRYASGVTNPLQGIAGYGGMVSPGMAVEVSNTDPAGIFTSMKNKLGL